MKSPLSDHICAVYCVYRAKRAPRLIHPVCTLSCIVSYLFLLFLSEHGPFFTPHRQPSASCWRCAADTRFKLEQSRWAAHAASTPRVRTRSTSHSGMPQANLPWTSGIQLQEAPPKGASSETEPEIRPKRRVWICRGRCGFDGARPCWHCSPLCFLIALVVLWLLFLVIMFIGQAVEQAEVAKAPETAWVYDTLEVCSASNKTYATLGAARGAGQLSRHCGACGQCSNAHDIQIYHDTKATLTETSTACAVRSITEGAAACVHDAAARGASLLG